MTLEEIQEENFKNFINTRYIQHLKQAYSRSLCTKITKDLFIKMTQENCFYCNRFPKRISKTIFTFKYNGLDRMDNTKGYTLENTVTCCSPCNYLKSTKTVKEFNNLLKSIDLNWLKLEKYLELLKIRYFQSLSYNEYASYILNIINKYSEN